MKEPRKIYVVLLDGEQSKTFDSKEVALEYTREQIEWEGVEAATVQEFVNTEEIEVH